MEQPFPFETRAIQRIQLAYESLRARSDTEKLYVAYSGGKDSECIAELCIEAVPLDAIEIHYHATGIDPPELVRHVKARFRGWAAQGIECHFDKPEANMHDLIVAKGPPTRLSRYCCEILKEGHGKDRVVITGVRWDESVKRAKMHDVLDIRSKRKEQRKVYHEDDDIRHRVMEHCEIKNSITINPIVDWTTQDVWAYIRTYCVDYCKLYDEGFMRLGCIGCPMAGNSRKRGFKRWPYMERYYRKAFRDYLVLHPDSCKRNDWHTVDDVWHWWLEDGVVSGQISIDEYENGDET